MGNLSSYLSCMKKTRNGVKDMSSSSPFSTLNWKVTQNGGLSEMRELSKVDIVSFNLLAPCYKRMETRTSAGRRHRESHETKVWMPRAELTLSFFRREILPNSTIVALQEFWMGNNEYKQMFIDEFERQGYYVTTLQRTGDKVRKRNPTLALTPHALCLPKPLSRS